MAQSIEPENAATQPLQGNAIEKVRCMLDGCTRKLTLLDQQIVCRCRKVFCQHHRFFEDHSCSFDYQGQAKDQLKKSLVKVDGNLHRLPVRI